MQMKMNVGLSGPVTSVPAGGVHVCDAAEAVRLFRAGYGVPTADSKDEFAQALDEQEAAEMAEADAMTAAVDAGADDSNAGADAAPADAAEPTAHAEPAVELAKADKPARGKKAA